MTRRSPRVLAVASGGGHWVQLLRLRPAFEGATMHFASTDRDNAVDVPGASFFWFPDANCDTKLRLIPTALVLLWIVLRVRPEVVISTGAAGGVIAICVARLLGARGMFIDSIANADDLSLAGRLAKTRADRTLSQWPEVARATQTEHHGAVM